MSVQLLTLATMPLEEIAAGTAKTLYWASPLDGTFKITSVQFVPGTNRVLDATNFTTYSMENAGVVVVSDSTELAGPAIVAGTSIEQTFAATGVGSALEVVKGDVLAFKKAEDGTGLALDGTWSVGLEHVRP